jgi:hypothetical protein
MAFDGVERRRHPRYPFAADMEFRLNTSSSRGICCAVSFDISESGVGSHIFSAVREGDEVVFATALPAPYQKGNIRWVRRYSEDFCMAGLMFTE